MILSKAGEILERLDLADLVGFEKSLLTLVPQVNFVTKVVHTNGFVKIVIARFSDESVLRAHLWNVNAGANVHNHRWDFESRVFAGSIGEITYSYASSSSRAKLYSDYSADDDRIRPNKKLQRLSETEHSTHFAGDRYSREASQIHKTEALQNGTVTLVATGRPIRKCSTVWSELPRLPLIRKHRQIVISVREFLVILNSHISQQK